MRLYFYTVKEKWKLIFCFFILTGIISCRHTPVFPETPVISFTNDINPVIISNCTQSGCHSNTGAHDEAFALLTYDDIMKHCDVVPGDPQQGKLYRVIKTLNAGQIMPKAPYPPLSDTQIQLIYLWIGQGAKNN